MSRVFGLFGYKRDGKFAKCVWGLFATSSAIVVAFFALASVEEDDLIKFIDGTGKTAIDLRLLKD